MPIYQYDCSACQRRVDLFFRSIKAVVDHPACPECGSTKMKKAVSRIAKARSDREAIDSIDFDQELGRLESGDERGFAKWAQRLGEQYDGALGTDFGALAERTMAGEDPSDRVDPAFTIKNRVRRAKEQIVSDSDTGGI
ncbi:MAG: zinc ribbon domain-containing protein [Chloroflexi bacterium]|nr:zinc ribbon domain-containing protein [Chloroflexota bacterium]MQC48426.1 zinc ribbon domain-containing protein [Chloroflexota bacterium]